MPMPFPLVIFEPFSTPTNHLVPRVSASVASADEASTWLSPRVLLNQPAVSAQADDKARGKDRRSARTGSRAPNSTVVGGQAQESSDPMTYALEEVRRYTPVTVLMLVYLKSGRRYDPREKMELIICARNYTMICTMIWTSAERIGMVCTLLW